MKLSLIFKKGEISPALYISVLAFCLYFVLIPIEKYPMKHLFTILASLMLIMLPVPSWLMTEERPAPPPKTCGVADTDQHLEQFTIPALGSPKMALYQNTDGHKSILLVGSRKYWKKKKLLVYFFDGPPEKKERAIRVANAWDAVHKYIQFELTEDKKAADIRVAFLRGGGYSAIVGTYADTVKSKAGITMWLDRLNYEDDVTFDRIVLHEFGHALGMLHELQNPDVPVLWDKPKVYRFFREEHGWDSSLVQWNIFRTLDPGTIDYYPYDPGSIMNYWIPDSLTLNNRGVALPLALSLTDKDKFTLLYSGKQK